MFNSVLFPLKNIIFVLADKQCFSAEAMWKLQRLTDQSTGLISQRQYAAVQKQTAVAS